MSYSVHVLHEGYSRPSADKETVEANCTCTLIIGPIGPIIVDTMTAWDADKIIQGLRNHNIKCDDIKYVICTHGHSDHIGNNHLFQNAELHFVGSSASKRDKYYEKLFDEKGTYVIDRDLYLMLTPGHTNSDITVVVNARERGAVGITGDLFEREEDVTNTELWREVSENVDMQQNSRRQVVSLVKWIVPGHGPMFKVTDEIFRDVSQRSHSSKDGDTP